MFDFLFGEGQYAIKLVFGLVVVIALLAASLPAVISSAVGGVQIGCHQVMAIPHCAMAQVGSFKATSVKIRRASS